MPITHARTAEKRGMRAMLSGHAKTRRWNSERNPNRNNGGSKSQFTPIGWTVRFVFDFGFTARAKEKVKSIAGTAA